MPFKLHLCIHSFIDSFTLSHKGGSNWLKTVCNRSIRRKKKKRIEKERKESEKRDSGNRRHLPEATPRPTVHRGHASCSCIEEKEGMACMQMQSCMGGLGGSKISQRGHILRRNVPEGL